MDTTASARISDDMFSFEAMADPYTYYGRLRDEDPIHWNEQYQLWVVTRHDDIVWLTRRPELFSSAVHKNDTRPPYPEIVESDLPLYEYVRDFRSNLFIEHDSPAHLEMRRVLHSFFTPKTIEATWRPYVKETVHSLLDSAEKEGSMDVMQDLATPLPVLVIAQMMGVPESERPHVRHLAERMLYLGRGEQDRMQHLVDAMQSFIAYIAPLVEKRMVQPANDFISVLADGEKRGIFTRHQVHVNTALLLQAGHETTINLLCNGTRALLQHPDQWTKLTRDPSAALVKTATEECLRYDSPVKSIQRIVMQDVEMRGKLLRKGDRIRWFISSANRDPNVFSNPNTFDITRNPNPHIAFGSGAHHCLGSTLARLEGQEVFKALAERFPHIRAKTDVVEYLPTIIFRTMKSLPVSLH